MHIPVELLQLLGVLVGFAATFVFGVSWGRKNPAKVDKIQEQIDALKEAVKKN